MNLNICISIPTNSITSEIMKYSIIVILKQAPPSQKRVGKFEIDRKVTEIT